VRRTTTTIVIILAVIAVAIAFALLTTISTLALPDGRHPEISANLQEITPTPTETTLSQAGSTDGIMWMGVIITTIVILPLVANRVLWQKQS
jgi:ABC-type Fe3+-siderophore transport system permease subunit